MPAITALFLCFTYAGAFGDKNPRELQALQLAKLMAEAEASGSVVAVEGEELETANKRKRDGAA